MHCIGKKRLFISFILSIILICIANPLYLTENTFKSIHQSSRSNKEMRIDIHNRGNSATNGITILSKNIYNKPYWCKNNKGSCVLINEPIVSAWHTYKIKFKVDGNGDITIALRGPDKNRNDIRYPVIIDYKNLVINEKTIFDKEEKLWHDKPFNYNFYAKNGEIVEVTFQARKHHFRFSDLKRFYNLNILMFINVLILAFLLSYKLAQYIERLKLLENQSWIDIIFTVVFIILLFIPMSHISTAERSVQENRMLAKKPSFFEKNQFNQQYPKQFEKWFDDRFGGRKLLVRLKTKTTALNSWISNPAAVFNKKTHWAFNKWQLAPVQQDEDKNKDILKSLEKIYNFCEKRKIKFYVLIVPEKIDLYHQYSLYNGKFSGEVNSSTITYLKNNAKFPIIYPLENIRKASKKNFVYFKTEHHWTEWGAYIGYQELLKTIQKDFPDINITSEQDYNIFYHNKVRGDWTRDFDWGQTYHMLNIKLPEKDVLDIQYKYYTPKTELVKTITDKPYYKTKHFKNKKISDIKAIVSGTSMNENLLQFLPYSFNELKYIRLNNVKEVPHNETFKLLKRYKKDIIEFQPEILILCITAGNLSELN